MASQMLLFSSVGRKLTKRSLLKLFTAPCGLSLPKLHAQPCGFRYSPKRVFRGAVSSVLIQSATLTFCRTFMLAQAPNEASRENGYILKP